ncbi:MAG: hypothetical protein Q9N34_05950 [Aquificota bacterium]|nr:hypothetical protein [Aquificota bacterium]
MKTFRENRFRIELQETALRGGKLGLDLPSDPISTEDFYFPKEDGSLYPLLSNTELHQNKEVTS